MWMWRTDAGEVPSGFLWGVVLGVVVGLVVVLVCLCVGFFVFCMVVVWFRLGF